MATKSRPHPQATDRTARLALSVVIVLVTASCATTRNARFADIDQEAQQGDYEDAVAAVESQQDSLYTVRDELLYNLDTGVLHFYAGDYETSISRLHEAERIIEELFTVSVTQATSTFLLNDNAQDYSGEDFEDIYLNIFKAIAFLEQGEDQGAFVEIRRINNKLNLLEDKYVGLAQQYNRADDAELSVEPGNARFYNSALARYLSLVLYRAQGDYDDARIDWQEIQEAFNEQSTLYDFPLPLDASVIDEPAGVRMSVVAFSGRAPLKRAETLRIVTGTDVVYIEYASESGQGELIPEGYGRFTFPGVEEGYRFVFQLPRMQLRGSTVDRIRVTANGRVLGELELMEDIERIAQDTFQIRQPMIFVKTVTRALVKGIAAERGKEEIERAAAESGSIGGSIAGVVGSVATDVAVEASEQADLRVSRYFPAYAYVGEWEVNPGVYDVEVEYYSGSSLVHVDRNDDVEISRRSPNLVTSIYNN